MRITVSALLASTLLISGCSSISESRANPFNWFGDDEPPAAQPVSSEEANPLIPDNTGLFGASRAENARYKGTPIDAISAVTLERVPGGVIIRATGVAATQGIYEPRLTPDNADESPVDGVLTYHLEAVRAEDVTVQGPTETREVIVARKLTEQELGNTRIIRVEGLQNSLEARR